MMATTTPIRSYGSARRSGFGYRPTYRAGAHCPSCAGTQWHVGRQTAECATCATALPIAAGFAA